MSAATYPQAGTPQRTLVLVEQATVRPASPPPPGQGEPDSGSGPATAASDAMRELWQRHGTALTRFALKLTLGDLQRAEDIVQESLLRAWRHPEVVGDGQRAIRSWLFTVTRRVAIDMWRARSRAEEIMDDEQVDWPDPVARMEQVDTAMDVRAALAQLTPEHRQVIVEMYYLGRSVVEIAEAHGIPAGTVKSRAYYGLRRLRGLLPPAAGDPASRPVQADLPTSA